MLQPVVRPTKRAVRPRVKMRPLFWSRIILDQQSSGPRDTFWHRATEPNFNVDEFERLFGQIQGQSTSSKLPEVSSTTRRAKVQVVKVLEARRSRALAIKLRALHCGPHDVRSALYQHDFSKLSVEALDELSQLRATTEELAAIRAHVGTDGGAPLDEPEQFLLDLDAMTGFAERVACLMTRKQFNETLFEIDQQLTTVQTACDDIRNNEALRTVLEMTLAFGNYMNGGTQRGQADGFDLTILPRLRDVKALDNNQTLLNYLVRLHMREYEEGAGMTDAQFPLPNPTSVTLASAVTFTEIESQLNKLSRQLTTHIAKAEEVYRISAPSILQPFKEQMEEFFDSAESMLARQRAKADETRQVAMSLMDYMTIKDHQEQMTSDSFFRLWSKFLEDYRQCWKLEQRRLAKEMFEGVQRSKRERKEKTRRRSTATMEGAGAGAGDDSATRRNLKEKFAQLRRDSEHRKNVVSLPRSQSTSNLEFVGSEGQVGPRRDLGRLETTTPPTRYPHRLEGDAVQNGGRVSSDSRHGDNRFHGEAPTRRFSDHGSHLPDQASPQWEGPQGRASATRPTHISLSRRAENPDVNPSRRVPILSGSHSISEEEESVLPSGGTTPSSDVFSSVPGTPEVTQLSGSIGGPDGLSPFASGRPPLPGLLPHPGTSLRHHSGDAAVLSPRGRVPPHQPLGRPLSDTGVVQCPPPSTTSSSSSSSSGPFPSPSSSHPIHERIRRRRSGMVYPGGNPVSLPPAPGGEARWAPEADRTMTNPPARSGDSITAADPLTRAPLAEPTLASNRRPSGDFGAVPQPIRAALSVEDFLEVMDAPSAPLDTQYTRGGLEGREDPVAIYGACPVEARDVTVPNRSASESESSNNTPLQSFPADQALAAEPKPETNNLATTERESTRVKIQIQSFQPIQRTLSWKAVSPSSESSYNNAPAVAATSRGASNVVFTPSFILPPQPDYRPDGHSTPPGKPECWGTDKEFGTSKQAPAASKMAPGRNKMAPSSATTKQAPLKRDSGRRLPHVTSATAERGKLVAGSRLQQPGRGRATAGHFEAPSEQEYSESLRNAFRSRGRSAKPVR